MEFANTAEWYNLAGAQTTQCNGSDLIYAGTQNGVLSNGRAIGLDPVLIDRTNQWSSGDAVVITGFALLAHAISANGTFTFTVLEGADGSGDPDRL